MTRAALILKTAREATRQGRFAPSYYDEFVPGAKIMLRKGMSVVEIAATYADLHEGSVKSLESGIRRALKRDARKK